MSYDPAVLTAKDRARLILGDTGALRDSSGGVVWLIPDETIQSRIDGLGFQPGLAELADSLATRFSQEPDEYEDESGVRVRWNERIEEWRRIAAAARKGTVGGFGRPQKGRYRSGKLGGGAKENSFL